MRATEFIIVLTISCTTPSNARGKCALRIFTPLFNAKAFTLVLYRVNGSLYVYFSRKREPTIKRRIQREERETRRGTGGEEKCKRQATIIILYK
jgi:hypothetical protein